jgi:hypothetical protein
MLRGASTTVVVFCCLLLAASVVTTEAQMPPATPIARDPTAVVTYSQLTWAPCSADSALQQFAFDESAGLWTDGATGRCLSILDKHQIAGDGGYGKVVLDVCGGSEYVGTPSGQAWKPDPASAIAAHAKCDMRSPIEPTNYCINVPNSEAPPDFQGNPLSLPKGTSAHFRSTCPARLTLQLTLTAITPLLLRCRSPSWSLVWCVSAGYNLVTYKACGSPNSMMIFKEDGTVSANAGYSAGQCLQQIPCDSKATPPCSLPAAWGWSFVVALGVVTAVYVGGGIGYTVRVQGEPAAGFVRDLSSASHLNDLRAVTVDISQVLTSGSVAAQDAKAPMALHPHRAMWTQVGGLISDGVGFTVAQAKAKLGKESADGYDRVGEAAALTSSPPGTAKTAEGEASAPGGAKVVPGVTIGGEAEASSEEELVE